MRISVKAWHLTLYLAILILVIITGLLEYRSRQQEILKMYRTQAAATAAAIAHGGDRQATLSLDLEQSYIQRALDLIGHVDQLDQDGLLTAVRLNELRRQNDFFSIAIFDAERNQILSPIGFPGLGRALMLRRPGLTLPGLLQPLFTGEQDTLIIGLEDRMRLDRNLAVEDLQSNPIVIGIKRTRGGVIAGIFTPEVESVLQSSSDLRQLLADMLDIEGLAYLSITVGGREPVTEAMAGINSDSVNSWSRLLLDENTAMVHGDQDFVEVTQPLPGVEQDAELLVGFTTGPLNRAQRDAAVHILLRSGLFTLLAILLIAVALSRQNTALLRFEKKRIEQEVSRLEKLSHLQDKQAAIGQLAAGVAHEIRNPLNAIGILAQRIRRECRPSESGQEEFEQFTSTMTSEIIRINELLEEFLAFARPTSLTLAPVDVSRLIEDVSKLYLSQAEEKGVTLSVRDIGGLQTEGDAQHLQQAVANVIKNALEATKRGDSITLTAQSRNGATVINIADTGSGISPESLGRIFDLFYTTRNEGIGIGLALTHKIIADHEGTIEVESTLGEGTTFTITIPGSTK